MKTWAISLVTFSLILLPNHLDAIVPPRPIVVEGELKRFSFPAGMIPSLLYNRHPRDMFALRTGPPKLAEFEDVVSEYGVKEWEEVRIPVLLIEFPDAHPEKSSTQGTFEELFFSRNTYPTGSFADYYAEVSYGKFSVSGDVWDWVEVDEDMDHYTAGYYGFNTYRPNVMDLVEDAVEEADQSHTGLDFADYDTDEDGVVDALFIVHPGQGAEETEEGDDFWSLYWEMDKPIQVDGVEIREFLILPELTCKGFDHLGKCVELGPSAIGVICHEFGHLLGLPDLYDINEPPTHEGIGIWGLMGGGVWGGDGDSPETPVHLSAWSKYYLGWLEPEILNEGDSLEDFTLDPVEMHYDRAVLLYPNGGDDPQYFLMANRQNLPETFDKNLPCEGILVWHVDPIVIEGGMVDNAVNTDVRHKGVDLEEADGNRDLDDYNPSRLAGDCGHPFPGSTNNRRLSRNTTPSSIPYLDGPRVDRELNAWMCITQKAADSYIASFAVLPSGAREPTCKEKPEIIIPPTDTTNGDNDLNSTHDYDFEDSGCYCNSYGPGPFENYGSIFIYGLIPVVLLIYRIRQKVNGL